MLTFETNAVQGVTAIIEKLTVHTFDSLLREDAVDIVTEPAI